MAVVISGGVVLSPSVSVPSHHSRLLYDNVFRQGVVTASGEQSAEFAKENATLDPATFNFWRPDTLDATLRVTLETAAVADYCLLAAHTLGTTRCGFRLEYHNGSEWVTIEETLRGGDNVFAILFDDVMAAQWGVALTDQGGSAIPSIGVVQIGKSLTMERGVTLDHAPIELSRRTVVEPNISNGGQWLGRSMWRQGVGTPLSFRKLTEGFVYEKLDPFLAHAERRPFGWILAPETRAPRVAYAWTDGQPIVPQYSGQQDRMDISLMIEGLME